MKAFILFMVAMVCFAYLSEVLSWRHLAIVFIYGVASHYGGRVQR